MAHRDILVIVASAGGVEALLKLAPKLPADLPAAVFVVVHTPPHAPSILPRLLTQAGPLPATHARDGEAIEPGRLYMAPPDFHLLLTPGAVRVVHGPTENLCRPAIDPLFRSAAATYGPRVIGVILTGSLSDGTAGMVAVKQRGGVAVVQDPADALFPGMPRNVLKYVEVDYCLPLSELAPALARLVAQPARAAKNAEPATMQREIEELSMVSQGTRNRGNNKQPGAPAGLTCADCKGTLWEIHEGKLRRFRCRIGHGYGTEGILQAGQSERVEDALWEALLALEEFAELARQRAAQAHKNKGVRTTAAQEEQAQRAEEDAQQIRQMLQHDSDPALKDGAEEE